MKHLLHHIVIQLVLIAAAASLFAGGKSTYDLNGPEQGPPGAPAKTASIASDRHTISRSVSAATIIEGGYFTIGTTGGVSQLPLDDNCGVTFGHPYAKTSYPLVHIDGVWGKPGRFFQTTGSFPRESGDSLILVYTAANRYEIRFTAYLESGGAKIHLISDLKNLDAAAHTFGLGLVLDPALGKQGDGVVAVAGAPLARDTALSSQSLASAPITIAERSASAFGMKIGLAFPSSAPSSVIVANWDDAAGGDTPSFTPSDVRRLYDAVVKIFWAPHTVQPGTSFTQEAVVTVMEPNFGNGVFLRWDVPASQSVENGIPFPAAFVSHVSIENVSQSAKSNVEVQIVSAGTAGTPPASKFTAVAQQSAASLAFPLQFKEIYENKVVDMLVVCKENNLVIDSLVHPFRLCSPPVSDTGLAVRFDSVMTALHPTVMVTFDVMKQSTRQHIFSLMRDNIFLYENNARITDYTLGKDTTGGAGAVDIVFVFDVTGSMSGSIAGVKNNVMEFADSLAARGVNFRLGMVTFLDAVENVYDFTTSAAAFKASVSAQYAHGGGDTPENSLDALNRACDMTFRDAAKRVFVWITDANYHEKNANTPRTRQDVVARLLSLDVTVHAIGALPYQTDWYDPITQSTGGNYYNISGNFRDILLDIGNLKGSNRYLLSYTSAVPKTATRELRLTVHYAGLGGSSTIIAAAPSPAIGGAPLACFPNPFNPQTTIRLDVPAGAHGAVAIYNILGQQIRSYRLAGTSGRTDIVWAAKDEAGRDVAAGLYLVRFTLYSQADRLLSADVAKILYLK